MKLDQLILLSPCLACVMRQGESKKKGNATTTISAYSEDEEGDAEDEKSVSSIKEGDAEDENSISSILSDLKRAK